MSHAEGTICTANADSSHAEGYGCRAYSECQHAQGKYNVSDAQNKYAHIVGNGTASERSNAHTLDWDGNAWFKGKVVVGGESMDEPNAVELGAGGGLPTGGAANQQLVTDANGNAEWQDRTHWKDYSNVILPETTVTVNADMGFAPILTPLGLELGKEYLVIWNGSKYNSTAVSTTYYGMPLVCIGNTGAMDTAYAPTGEPFIIGDFGSDAMGFGFTSAAIPLDGSTSASVEIREAVYHKLDKAYMPDGFTPIMVVNITGGGVSINVTDGWVADKTFDEIMDAVNAGSMVFFKRVPSDGKTYIMPLTQAVPTTIDDNGTEQAGIIYFGCALYGGLNLAYGFTADGVFGYMSD